MSSVPIKSIVYQSSTASIVKLNSGGKASVEMKAGSFVLNGKRIVVKIGDNLKSISAKINKHLHETGIKAKIVEKDNGYKLHLTSKNKPVQIEDRNGVLANLYNKGHIGKSSKHLIQVTGGEVFYNKPLPKMSQNTILLNMFNVPKVYNLEPNALVVLNELQEDDAVQEEEVLVPELFPDDVLQLEEDVQEEVLQVEEKMFRKKLFFN